MIVAVDIDHTLLHSAWRDDHIALAMETGRWDTYHSLFVKDAPATPIINVVIALHNAGHEIYIVTARPRKWLRQTYSHLHKIGIKIDHDHILMRPLDDYKFRPSPEMKQELLSHLKVDLLIEDRSDVVEAFAKDGITTLQVRLVQ